MPISCATKSTVCEFVKKMNYDLNEVPSDLVTLVIRTDDTAMIAAITDTVRRFHSARRVIEEATIPADDCNKMIAQELNLIVENPDEVPFKHSRNVARRHVEAVFEDFPQSIPFRTLGELYKWMTGKDTARANKPETHIRMLNKKRLPNRPKIVNIIRMDVRGNEYKNAKAI